MNCWMSDSSSADSGFDSSVEQQSIVGSDGSDSGDEINVDADWS